ncbi:hypothetical protein BJX63DRAFT_430834 [Aspergillus granulosus]|uniref:Uncharacterized protein n=1 Tax=Aspergillus granulosus TaxID=176169 RepID=A0ABR4HIK0_9EURO
MAVKDPRIGSIDPPLATNLQRHLLDKRAKQLDIRQSHPLEDLYANWGHSHDEFMAKCDVIFTMLANDRILTTATIESIAELAYLAPSPVSGIALSALAFDGTVIAAIGHLVFAEGYPVAKKRGIVVVENWRVREAIYGSVLQSIFGGARMCAAQAGLGTAAMELITELVGGVSGA